MNIINREAETYLGFEANSIPRSRLVDREIRCNDGRSELVYRRDAPAEVAASRHLARDSTPARGRRSVAYSDANAMQGQLQNVRGVAS